MYNSTESILDDIQSNSKHIVFVDMLIAAAKGEGKKINFISLRKLKKQYANRNKKLVSVFKIHESNHQEAPHCANTM